MKKNHLKIWIVLVITGMLFSFGVPIKNVPVQAAKKVSISSKKLTLEVGGSIKLSLKNAKGDISWASSKPKVAKVSTKGKVTALREGKTTITAIHNGQAYTCKITVEASDSSSSKSGGSSGSKSGDSSGSKSGDSSGGKSGGSSGGKSGDSSSGKKSDSSSGELSPTEIYDLCSKSVVEVNAGYSLGSGFYIEKKRIVTNYHVIEGATSLTVKTMDDKEYAVLKVVGYSKDLDLAVLEVDHSGTPLKRNTHNYTMGEKTYTIGSSLGLTNTFSDGIITNPSRKIDNTEYIQTNTAISHGNSGGPLINAYGEVIGITTASYSDGQNLNLAIKISELDKLDLDNPITTEEYIYGKKNKGAEPDFYAILESPSDETYVVSLIVSNLGGKDLILCPNATKGNAALYSSAYDSVYDYVPAYLVDAEKTLELDCDIIYLDHLTIKPGETKAAYFALDYMTYVYLDGLLLYEFSYDGVGYYAASNREGVIQCFLKE